MKKRFLHILLAIALLLAMIMPVSAVMPRLVDDAGLLSSAEREALLQRLNEISERQLLDVVVVTVDSLAGKTPMEFADDYYDDHGYGYGANCDGILLLVCTESSDWWISTAGYGITAFTDAGLDYISEEFLPYLNDGYYAEAFETYADLCDEFITKARAGSPYDVQTLPKGSFGFFGKLITSLIAGLVVALIATSVMKGQLKSVKKQTAASDYVVKNSLKITESNEFFLYRNVHKVRRESNSGSGSGGSRTHRSSSGRSHGGRGGKF